MLIRNLSAELSLVTDSQEIAAISQSIGRDLSDYHCLFVGIKDGEYTKVYATFRAVPYLDTYAEEIL